MDTSLIYIHIGKHLPKYIYDSIYQSTIVSNNNNLTRGCIKIYILLDDTLIESFNEKISKFNNIYTKDQGNCIICVPLSIFKLPQEYNQLIDNLPEQIKTFRESFWIYTITRFFYLERFMSLFHIKNAFHIENDIMIYENLKIIESSLDKNKIYMVRDSISPLRVIASIMYLNSSELKNVLSHFLKELTLNPSLNDMQLLGSYKSENIEFLPFNTFSESKYIYDSCAIGQFLGGVDPRNIKNYNTLSQSERDILILNNPTVNFINETCTFKLNDQLVFQKSVLLDECIIPLNLYYVKGQCENLEINKNNTFTKETKQIFNIHVHSKQLYQFSSIFNIKYSDIITGDRVISLCDFVITTDQILKYHKNIENFIKHDNILVVKNFKNVNIKKLNSIFQDAQNKKSIKIFIYTHILTEFIDNILFNLDKSINYKLYLHNSDHQLENIHVQKLLECKHIEKVYSQNINCDLSEKLSLLPIGLANSMFSHGNVISLYKTMKNTYYLNKTKNLYININPNTFAYRQRLLDELTILGYINSPQKQFKEYLEELSQYRFSLCVRGNGIDTHRFFESLYLGVIPVIINNTYTNMNNYVKYLRSLGLPFYEITQDKFEYCDEFFNENLYKKTIKECGSSIYNLPQLKLNYYT